MDIVVSSSAGLLKALSSAHSGDTIYLKAGTYDNINLTNINIAGNVTITSKSSTNEAVINNLMVKNSSGLTFSNLDLTAKAGAADYNFQVYGSSNINLDKLTVTGAGFDQQTMMIRNSQNVTVTNSEFTNSYNALTFMTNTNLTISDNLFHDIRCDGVHGNMVSGLYISGNMFTDFHPEGAIGTTGDHADAIQIWTDNTTWAPTNIVISDNVVQRGTGSQIQGIWLRDDSETQPFTNVTIANNTVEGGMYNGIAVWSGKNVTLTGNEVYGTTDQLSWIRLHDVTGASVSDNSATDYVYENVTGLTQSSNQTVALNTVSDIWQSRLDLSSSLQADMIKALGSLANPLMHPALTVQAVPAVKDVTGTAGNDVLHSGTTGTVDMTGGAGNDTYYVDTANTTIHEAANGGTDTVYTSVNHTLEANIETMYVTGSGLTVNGNDTGDVIVAMAGDTVMNGGAGVDDLRGGAGNDTLNGGDGNDILRGGAGDDILNGGAGNDTIEGGTGNDTMTGGSGADTFQFRNGDLQSTTLKTITDFSHADGDHINLTMVDANTATAAIDHFKFIGSSAFTDVAGQLRDEVIDGNTYLYGDTNGDGHADFTIKLLGVTNLVASDLWL